MKELTFQKKLLDSLAKDKLISPESYQEYLLVIKKDPQMLFEAMEREGAINQEVLAQYKAKLLQLPYYSLENKVLDKEVLKILPEDLARNYRMMVLEKNAAEFNVGMVDPTNYKAVEAIEFLGRKINLTPKYFIISPATFNAGLKYYESFKEEVVEALGFAEEKLAPESPELSEKPSPLEEAIQSAPVSKILSVIFRHAVEGGASDIHIEPHGDKSRVRYRIDGILHTSLILPIYVHSALVSRIKVLSNLKIDETRLPQDGRIHEIISGKKIDFRVSIIPLVNQEKVAMRILESPEKAPTFEDLGFFPRHVKLMHEYLTKPTGMFLVTGPTGSGKSTTLFAALSLLNKEGTNISTLEDPVEYFIPGINQSQVKTEIGYTFANGLRAFLRQDPNIIMVGEIRDNETAELAIHAALTGHLVLSTVHTNDAKSSIHRLIDMNVETFLLANTINLIIAQRLVRKICDRCRAPYQVPQDVVIDAKKTLSTLPEKSWPDNVKRDQEMVFYHGEGCSRCGNTGYKGRLSVGELIVVTKKMRDIIAKGYVDAEVMEELRNQDFVALAQDGWLKAILGLTTAEEVLRVTRTDF